MVHLLEASQMSAGACSWVERAPRPLQEPPNKA